MVYLLHIFVGLGIVSLFLLCVRLFAPDFIYALRAKVLQVRAWRHAYETEANPNTPNDEQYKILVADIRVEASTYTPGYALKRVEKIRELYHAITYLLEQNKEGGKELQPQLCIIEAANLASNLAERLEPIPDQEERHTVDAYDLLHFIYQNQVAAQKPIYRSKEEMKKIEDWFSDNVISIEQTTELLLAAVFGLAYRFKVQSKASQNVEVKAKLT